MRSLQRTLTVSTTVAMAVVLCVMVALICLAVRSALVRQFDRSLLETARVLAASVEQERRALDLGFEDVDMREFAEADGPSYLELWLPDGSVLCRSPSLGGGDLERFGGSPESPVCRWAALPNGRPGRMIGLSFMPRREDEDEPEDLEYLDGSAPYPPVALPVAGPATASVEPSPRMRTTGSRRPMR